MRYEQEYIWGKVWSTNLIKGSVEDGEWLALQSEMQKEVKVEC